MIIAIHHAMRFSGYMIHIYVYIYIYPLLVKGYLLPNDNPSCPVLIQSNPYLSITHCMLILDQCIMSMCYYQLYDSICVGPVKYCRTWWEVG